jgi:hypothetical protein
MIEGRGARAGFYGPSFIHTYIHTYISSLLGKKRERRRGLKWVLVKEVMQLEGENKNEVCSN